MEPFLSASQVDAILTYGLSVDSNHDLQGKIVGRIASHGHSLQGIDCRIGVLPDGCGEVEVIMLLTKQSGV